ncbi:MarR family winged helix-turn-helix transcriptional regulator [Cellulomonas soli]|uniref:MarR family winged helix-turn-helix transcriptional regulator n=1 Tax=Cellulomonas soli TaxID=931535 RepID=UPI003F86A3C2
MRAIDALALAQRRLGGAMQREAAMPPASISAVVHLLAERGSLAFSDLACELDIDAPAVSKRVAWLVEQGYAERTTDTADRRARHVALTSEGETLHQAMNAELTRRLDIGLADWSAEDTTELLAYAERLTDALWRAADHAHRRRPGRADT